MSIGFSRYTLESYQIKGNKTSATNFRQTNLTELVNIHRLVSKYQTASMHYDTLLVIRLSNCKLESNVDESSLIQYGNEVTTLIAEYT